MKWSCYESPIFSPLNSACFIAEGTSNIFDSGAAEWGPLLPCIVAPSSWGDYVINAVYQTYEIWKTSLKQPSWILRMRIFGILTGV